MNKNRNLKNQNSQKYLILNLPDTEKYLIHREWAGTYGTGEIKESYTRKRVLPIWILYVASALKKLNIKYKIIDSQTEKYNIKSCISEIKKYNPSFIVSMPCLPSYKKDIELLNEIKNQFPEIKILLIGGIVNSLNKKILNDSKIDFLIEGRYPFYNNIVEFVKNHENAKGLIYKNKDKIIKNPKIVDKNDLNDIKFEIYKQLDLKKYLMKSSDIEGNTIEWLPILTGVGCPYACTYCAYPIAFGKKFFYKDIDNVIKEISYLVKNFNIKGFLMRDVVFTKDKKRVIEFCKKIIEKKLDIRFLFETRVDLIDKEIVKFLKKAGCYQINFGVESGNSKILRNVGKPGVNIDLLKKTFSLTRKEKITNMAHIIIGLPGENKKTINDTYKLIKQIKADEVNFNFITPYPGTKLFEFAQKNNLIIKKDYSEYTSHTLVMRTKDLTRQELKKYGKKIERKYTIYKLFTDNKFRKYWIKKYINYIRKSKIPRFTK
jgi:radical SAM superfamily enzyme YgiQ (UPF0313 family)